MAKRKSVKKKVNEVNSFSRVAILKSQKYERFRDILAVLLEDDKLYTSIDIEKILTDIKNN